MDGLRLQLSLIYSQRKAESCVYYKKVGDAILIIAVLINNFLVAYISPILHQKLLIILCYKYQVKYLAT